jgi:hypothetical protein
MRGAATACQATVIPPHRTIKSRIEELEVGDKGQDISGAFVAFVAYVAPLLIAE